MARCMNSTATPRAVEEMAAIHIPAASGTLPVKKDHDREKAEHQGVGNLVGTRE